MAFAGSAVRMYLFYAFAVISLLATAAVLGTVIPDGVALVVGFLFVLLSVLLGLFWYGRLRE